MMSREQITAVLDQVLTVDEIAALTTALETRIDVLFTRGAVLSDEGIARAVRTAGKLGLTLRSEWLTDDEMAAITRG
jgi:hypothetical protein